MSHTYSPQIIVLLTDKRIILTCLELFLSELTTIFKEEDVIRGRHFPAALEKYVTYKDNISDIEEFL